MTKKLLSTTFILMLFFLGFSQKQGQDVQTTDQSANGPEISFTKVVHDYGTIEQNADGTCEFDFTNTGNEPLVLSTVRSSCGCTVPQWPREPILPGKSEKIKVKYDTRRMGAINKSITVLSNAKTSSVVLRISGKVVPKTQEAIPEKAPGTGTQK